MLKLYQVRRASRARFGRTTHDYPCPAPRPPRACVAIPRSLLDARWEQHYLSLGTNPLIDRVIADAEDVVLAAEELRYAAQAIGKISWAVGVEDVLDSVFRDFCIGK